MICSICLRIFKYLKPKDWLRLKSLRAARFTVYYYYCAHKWLQRKVIRKPITTKILCQYVAYYAEITNPQACLYLERCGYIKAVVVATQQMWRLNRGLWWLYRNCYCYIKDMVAILYILYTETMVAT